MLKFKTPNTGLKQYANLSAEAFFKETFKRNESIIKQATGGKISESQWVNKMLYEMKTVNKVSPREQVRLESLKYQYYKGDRAAWNEIIVREDLKRFVNADNVTIYDKIRTKVKDEKGHFANIGKAAEWIEGDTMKVGRFLIHFDSSPRKITLEDTKTGKVEDFSTEIEDITEFKKKRAIQRRKIGGGFRKL